MAWENVNRKGPQGSSIGLLEYLSQSNNNSDCVDPELRFKFLDDLSVLEVVNLLTVGISSYNIRMHVPSDIPSNNGFIPSENLHTKNYIENINQWTKKQKMRLNFAKSKLMIFNPSRKYQFTTRLEINGQNLEVIEKTRLLGTILTNDLKWEENTRSIVQKAKC